MIFLIHTALKYALYGKTFAKCNTGCTVEHPEQQGALFNFGYNEVDEIRLLGEDTDGAGKGHINNPHSLNFYKYDPGTEIDKSWYKILPEQKAVLDMYVRDLTEHGVSHNSIRASLEQTIFTIRKLNRRMK